MRNKGRGGSGLDHQDLQQCSVHLAGLWGRKRKNVRQVRLARGNHSPVAISNFFPGPYLQYSGVDLKTWYHAQKLYGVSPLITDPLPYMLRHFVRKKSYKWYVSCDTKTVVNILLKVQVPSSNGLGVMTFWSLGGKGSVSEWVNWLISDKGVCRTTPATPGLLNIF